MSLTAVRALRWPGVIAVVALAWLSACGAPPPGALADAEPLEAATPSGGIGAEDAAKGSTDRPGVPKLVVLGDSLTAGLGIDPDQAFPARLQARLDAHGYELQVVGAGISGDTTAGGMRRLEWALEGDVQILIVALGGNDGLRGLPVEQMSGNLRTIITTAQARGVEVLLAGMEAPPNFGPAYTDDFRDVFSNLARDHDVAFVPFLLEGVAGEPTLNQSDQIHPNAEGADQVAAHLWPTVERLAQKLTVQTAP